MFKIFFKFMNVLSYNNQEQKAVYNIEEGRFVTSNTHDNTDAKTNEFKQHSLQSIVVIN